MATTAVVLIALTWLASSLIVGTSPAAVAGPAPDQAVYPDQGLRNRAAAPVDQSYPDQGLRNRAAAPLDQSYPDQGLRHQAAVPVAHEDYLDFGQRHSPAGIDR